jgi:hypothetical protein
MDLVEDNTNDLDEDGDLDTSWIQRETQIQNIQNNYSREPMEAIHGIFIYINQNNYIEKIMREMITLTPGDAGTGSHITPDMLLKIIQTKKLRTPVSKYKFTSLFTNVIDIDPDKIQNHKVTLINVKESLSRSISVGFKAIPDYRKCRKCALFQVCEKRAAIPQVTTIDY